MSTSEGKRDAVSEMFGQAAKLFQAGMEAGLKVQEESAKSLVGLFTGFSAPQPWHEQARQAMEKAASVGRQNAEQAMKLMRENTESGLELLDRAFNARPTDAPPDLQALTRETWETAIGSLRRNTEVIVEAHARLADSWQEITQVFSKEQANGQSASQPA